MWGSVTSSDLAICMANPASRIASKRIPDRNDAASSSRPSRMRCSSVRSRPSPWTVSSSSGSTRPRPSDPGRSPSGSMTRRAAAWLSRSIRAVVPSPMTEVNHRRAPMSAVVTTSKVQRQPSSASSRRPGGRQAGRSDTNPFFANHGGPPLHRPEGAVEIRGAGGCQDMRSSRDAACSQSAMKRDASSLARSRAVVSSVSRSVSA